MAAYSGKHVFLVALLATLLNLIPSWLVNPGADVLFHYALIDCFSTQLWRGDIYPRWCEEANAGLGSPVFIFYFPLPYYITALFHPLSYLGVGVEGQYLLSVMCATFVSFLTCQKWLREIVSPGRAMLCAAIFIFLPYRMELMYFRTAFAELWCMAFLPLLFMYTRQIALGHYHSWAMLGIAVAAAILSHVPVTCIALLGCGVQLLWLGTFRYKAWFVFALAIILAAMATAIYWVPAMHYSQFLHYKSLEFMRSVWVNQFVSLSRVLSRVSVMVGLLVTSLCVIGLSILMILKRKQIENMSVRREVVAWLMIVPLACILMFPVSMPAWELFLSLTGIMTPWRAQLLLSFVIIYFLAIKMQWLMSDKQMKTWRCDYGALCILLALVSLTMLTTRPPEVSSLYQTVMDSKVINATEYRPRWVSDEYSGREKIIERYQQGGKRHALHVSRGEGTATLLNLKDGNITIAADIKTDALIEVEHLFFPIWRVRTDGLKIGYASSEYGDGYLQFFVRQGKHIIELDFDLAERMRLPYILAMIASIFGATELVFFALYYRRRHAK